MAEKEQVKGTDMADKKKSGSKKPTGKTTKSAIMRGMESSKKQRAAAVKAKPKNPTEQQKREQQQKQRQGTLREYFSGVKIETKKVVWPTRKELVSYTIVVFIACAFFGVFLWGVDSGFLAIIREVFNISMN
jgi:preprotein translocase subunit SecE